MDLFDYAREMNKEKEAPLAGRMRPTTLDEVVGQSHIIGKDKLLYRAIKADKLSSIIFYGPPGTGKTTLAKVIANTTKANFVQMNATTSGKKEKNAPGGELKITDTPSNQDKALSCSISPAQKEALEEVLCSIIQDTPRDQRDALKVELNQIICECTDKINKSKNTLSYPTLL